MSEWKTMETAPKDGTEFLAFNDGMWSIVHWFSDDKELMWFNGDSFFEPTHWMPLPEPPKE